ncbi:Hsp20 family protein [Methanoculleus chikugoensis]|uniref:Hsp20/alpha crystallin family protein n=1 Tax=Methanoculleus chikugoensis TaxID=118126 RepID=UPI0006D16681|nr:Hsp20/alpha crystallin family protein [Methanoculleus chikugoensis]
MPTSPPASTGRGISVRLLDARTLRIAARREEAKEEREAGYHVRERRFGAISRTVSLPPTDVRDEEANATFKNGVLEVRLKKVAGTRGKEIALTEGGARSSTESRWRQNTGRRGRRWSRPGTRAPATC